MDFRCFEYSSLGYKYIFVYENNVEYKKMHWTIYQSNLSVKIILLAFRERM